MLIRWIKTEDTPLRYVAAGIEAEVDGELAERLIAQGIAEPVKAKAERAVRPRAEKAVKE